MMKLVSAAAIGTFLALGAVAVSAQNGFTPPETAEEAVEMRQAVMKENGGVLRSARGLSGTEAVTAMTTLRDNFSHVPDLFPEDSIVGDTKALPAIWEDWEGFVAIANASETAAADALAAAEAGDADSYAAALQSLMGTCGQCHQQFRAE